MKKWESVLRRDTEAWESFKDWLDELTLAETKKMIDVTAAEHDLQRGIVMGIAKAKFAATANEREEMSRARREG